MWSNPRKALKFHDLKILMTSHVTVNHVDIWYVNESIKSNIKY
jgi:hypothetical protein